MFRSRLFQPFLFNGRLFGFVDIGLPATARKAGGIINFARSRSRNVAIRAKARAALELAELKTKQRRWEAIRAAKAEREDEELILLFAAEHIQSEDYSW